MKLSYFERVQIDANARRSLYLALATVAENQNSWVQALIVMAKQFKATKHALGPLAEHVVHKMRGFGSSVSDRRGLGSELLGIVPEDEAMLIQAGENSGRLHEGLRNAAEFIDAKGRLRKIVMGHLATPLGAMAAMFMVFAYFSVSLLPMFEEGKPRDQWPEEAQAMGWFADNIIVVGGALALAILLVVGFINWAIPNWTGPIRRIADRHILPFSLVSQITGANFLKSLSGYIDSGCAFDDAVKYIAEVSSPYVKEQCQIILASLNAGQSAELALCEAQIIPRQYHWIVHVYAMGTGTAKSYCDIASEVTLNVEMYVNRLFAFVDVLMKLGIAVCVFWTYGALSDIAS